MKNRLKVHFRTDPAKRKKRVYRVRGKVWIWKGGQGAWHFVTVPPKQSREIELHHGGFRRGWGAVRVEVKLGKSVWQTSIFPYSKVKAYILPLKASVRQKEAVKANASIQFVLTI